MKLIFRDPQLLTILLLSSALIGQGSGFGKVYFFHLILVFCSIQFVLKKEFSLDVFKRIFFPLVLGAYSAVSLVWSSNISSGLLEVAQLWMGITFLFLVLSSGINSQRIYQVLRVVIYANIVISLGEALELFRYPYSLFSSLATEFGKIQGDWSPSENDIPTGFHWNPNNNAFFMLIFSPVVLSKAKKFESFLYLTLASYVIFMSSSKLVLIGWITLVFLYMYFYLSRKALIVIGSALIIIATTFFTALDNKTQRSMKYLRTIPSISRFVAVIPSMFIQRFNNQTVTFDYTGLDLSLHERLTYLDGLAILINENPVLGVGAGGLSSQTHQQAGKRLSLSTPHFYLIELWSKYGFIFVIVYLFWILSLTFNSYKIDKFSSLSLVFFLLFSPVVSTVGYFLPMWGVFVYHLSLLNRAENRSSAFQKNGISKNNENYNKVNRGLL